MSHQVQNIDWLEVAGAALALARASKVAGAQNIETPERAVQRAANMIRLGYVFPGDPYGWGGVGEAPLATVLLERKGGPGDCEPPHDYYGPDPLPEVPGLVFEPVNAAVVLVYAFDPQAIGIHYGDPCPVCARRGFHAADCPEKG